MAEIPEELLDEARLLVRRVWLHHSPMEQGAAVIAQALMSERAAQREIDAGIAEAVHVFRDEGGQVLFEGALPSGIAVAKAIREQTQPVKPTEEDEADLAQAGAALEEFHAKGGTTLEQLERELGSPGYTERRAKLKGKG